MPSAHMAKCHYHNHTYIWFLLFTVPLPYALHCCLGLLLCLPVSLKHYTFSTPAMLHLPGHIYILPFIRMGSTCLPYTAHTFVYTHTTTCHLLPVHLYMPVHTGPAFSFLSVPLHSLLYHINLPAILPPLPPAFLTCSATTLPVSLGILPYHHHHHYWVHTCCAPPALPLGGGPSFLYLPAFYLPAYSREVLPSPAILLFLAHPQVLAHGVMA